MTELEIGLLSSRRMVLEKLADEIIASDYRSARVKLIRLRHVRNQLEEIAKELGAAENELA